MFERLAIVAIGLWTVAGGLLGCQAIMLAVQHWWPAITVGTIWEALSIPWFWPAPLVYPIPLSLFLFVIGCLLFIGGVVFGRPQRGLDSLAAHGDDVARETSRN
jgi:hypothetical protein